MLSPVRKRAVPASPLFVRICSSGEIACQYLAVTLSHDGAASSSAFRLGAADRSLASPPAVTLV